jgi:DNA-binding XRE family transcriptional regulator
MVFHMGPQEHVTVQVGQRTIVCVAAGLFLISDREERPIAAVRASAGPAPSTVICEHMFVYRRAGEHRRQPYGCQEGGGQISASQRNGSRTPVAYLSGRRKSREMGAAEDYKAELARYLECFGANVRRLRRASGLSQERLALATGLHRTEIGKIELGQVEPRLSTISILATGLEVTPNDLYAELWVPELRKPSHSRPLR